MVRGLAPGEERRGDAHRRSAATCKLVTQHGKQALRERLLIEVQRAQAVEGQAVDLLVAVRPESESEVEVVYAVGPAAAGERLPCPGDDGVDERRDFAAVRGVELPIIDLESVALAASVCDFARGFPGGGPARW